MNTISKLKAQTYINQKQSAADENYKKRQWENTVEPYKLATEIPSNGANPAVTEPEQIRKNPAKCKMYVNIYEYKNIREEKRAFLRRSYKAPFANLSTRLHVHVESASATRTFASAEIRGGTSLKPLDENFGVQFAKAYADSSKAIPPETLTRHALRDQKKSFNDRLNELHLTLKYRGFCIINGEPVTAEFKEVKVEKYINGVRDSR